MSTHDRVMAKQMFLRAAQGTHVQGLHFHMLSTNFSWSGMYKFVRVRCRRTAVSLVQAVWQLRYSTSLDTPVYDTTDTANVHGALLLPANSTCESRSMWHTPSQESLACGHPAQAGVLPGRPQPSHWLRHCSVSTQQCAPALSQTLPGWQTAAHTGSPAVAACIMTGVDATASHCCEMPCAWC